MLTALLDVPTERYWRFGVRPASLSILEVYAEGAIAEVIGRHLSVPVEPVTPDAAAGHFGWIGAFFAVDAPASSALTQERLGWRPTHIGLTEDLEQGHYFEPVATAAS